MTDMAIDPEDLFPPRRGGMVDTVRRQRQAESDQLEALNDDQAGAPVPASGYQAVRVRPEAADTGVVRTITLSSAYPVARLLPADPGRRSAVILAIDNDVYVTGSQGLANDVSGSATASQVGYFPAGIGLPIDNQAEWWVAATTTATNTRVTVITNRDSSQ
jgi:hypothetical protein